MLFQSFFRRILRWSLLIVVGLSPYVVLADDEIVETDSSPQQVENNFKSVVPLLIGLRVEDVIVLLPQYDLSLGTVTEIITTDKDKIGKIITQSITEGAETNRWENIDVSVNVSSEKNNVAKPQIELKQEIAPTPQTPINEVIIIPEVAEVKEEIDNTKKSVTENREQAEVKQTVLNNEKSTPKNRENTSEELKSVVIPEVNELKETVSTSEKTALVPEVSQDKDKPSIEVKKASQDKSTVEIKDASQDKPSIAIKAVSAKENPEVIPVEVIDNNDEKQNESVSVSIEEDKKDTNEHRVKDNVATKSEKMTLSNTASTAPAPRSASYGGSKVRVSISPSEIQVTRKITMEIQLNPPIESDKLVYQFNLSGKSYTRKTPVFTHTFEEEGSQIITASVRILGKPWIHSNSRRISIGKYIAKKIKVPNLVGLDEVAAKALLESKGLLVGNTQEKIIKGGKGIIKQMPAAGSIRTEDDNKIHYVKAIDEKFKLSVAPPSTEVDTGKTVTILAQLSPKASGKKVRYRFIVNGTPYFSTSSHWKHIFEKSGNNTVVAEAIITGEGTFTSPAMNFGVQEKWSLPKAVITPFTVSVEAGKTVTFKSASSYDRRGGVNIVWVDAKGRLLEQNQLAIDTTGLSEGEHTINLRIKDEKGYEDKISAQLIITAAPEAEDSKINEKVAAADSTDADKETKTAEEQTENQTQLTEVEIIQQQLLEEAQRMNAANLVLEAEKAKANGVAEEEEEVLEIDLSNQYAENVMTSPSIEMSETANTQLITASDTQAAEKRPMKVNVVIWLGSIIAILLAIFWVLRRSIKGQKKPIPEFESEPDLEVRAEIPASPYKQSVDTTTSNKTKVEPHLVDFDLGDKPNKTPTNKDSLTDFKLDDK